MVNGWSPWRYSVPKVCSATKASPRAVDRKRPGRTRSIGMVEAGLGGVRSAVPTLTPSALSLSASDLGESTRQLYMKPSQLPCVKQVYLGEPTEEL